MVISDDLLSKSSKSFIVIPEDQTLVDALRTLQQQGGDDSWFLVVDLGDGHYLATRFSEMQAQVKSKGQAILSIPLKDLGDPLIRVEAVEQSTALSEAQQRAESTPAKLVVVTWADAVVGVLSASDIPRAKPSEEVPTPPVESVQEEGDRAADISVQVADDVMGDVIIAGDDVIIQAREEEPATRLGRAVAWVQRNPIITVLGFLLTVALPTAWFLATEVVPTLTTSEVMGGEWNVAVAGFTPVGDQSIKRKDATEIAQVFYNRLEAEMAELGAEADIVVQVWDPKRTGVVKGDTPEERSANAEALAGSINADVVIYGTVQRVGDSLQVKPEFYVNIENYYEAEEVVGQHSFGGDITIANLGAAQIGLNRELARRSQALALVTSGLSLYFTHAYEDALGLFELANADDLWASDSGREVVYLFQGNAAGRAKLLDEAEDAYQTALAIEPEYSRGYAGLASVHYLRSLEDTTSADFEPDMDELNQAVEYFEQALEAEIQPPTADIPTKVAIGLGQVFLVEWYTGQDTLAMAIEQFELVLEQYGEGENPRIREFAAEAHARLGFIERETGSVDVAIQEYSKAIVLSTSPARKGLYWATLADLYAGQEEAAEAEVASRNAIEEYTLALTLTSQDEQRAEYWAGIATRHEKLGEIDEAIDALEEALDLLPEDSPDRAQYESQLSDLKAAE